MILLLSRLAALGLLSGAILDFALTGPDVSSTPATMPVLGTHVRLDDEDVIVFTKELDFAGTSLDGWSGLADWADERGDGLGPLTVEAVEAAPFRGVQALADACFDARVDLDSFTVQPSNGEDLESVQLFLPRRLDSPLVLRLRGATDAAGFGEGVPSYRLGDSEPLESDALVEALVALSDEDKGRGVALDVRGWPSCRQVADVVGQVRAAGIEDVAVAPSWWGMKDRFYQRWQAAMDGDWIEAYAFLSPEQRELTSMGVFLANKDHHHYAGLTDVELFGRDGDRVFIAHRIEWTPRHPILEGRDLSDWLDVAETWVWEDGEWYFQSTARRREFLERHPEFR